MMSLRLYYDVARHRSFSQAAAEHGITQSAASQRINQLEKRLGVTLLDRSVRPLALTEAGELFLRGCQELLERYDRLEQQVAGLAPNRETHVRVDAIYSAGIDLLNQLKDSFEHEHPNLTVLIEYKQPAEVYEAVRQRRCDMGIVSYPQRWREVDTIPLRDEVMGVVCAPHHQLARRKRVRPDELNSYQMAAFEPHLPVGRRIRRYLREYGGSPRIAANFDNIDTIKGAVAVTDQFSILPRRTVLREVAAGTLAVVELTPGLVRPIGIIYRRRGRDIPLPPAAQAFADFLLEYAGPKVDAVSLVEREGKPLVGGLV